MSQSRLEPHFGASARRTHFYTLLPECIRAPCGAAARIADGSPLQAACIAPLRPRGPLALLCGYPPDVVTSLSPCWSCEAWSHAVRRVRLDAKRPVRGLGEPQQGASGNPKGYPDALLAYVSTHSLNLPSVCAIMRKQQTDKSDLPKNFCNRE